MAGRLDSHRSPEQVKGACLRVCPLRFFLEQVRAMACGVSNARRAGLQHVRTTIRGGRLLPGGAVSRYICEGRFRPRVPDAHLRETTMKCCGGTAALVLLAGLPVA